MLTLFALHHISFTTCSSTDFGFLLIAVLECFFFHVRLVAFLKCFPLYGGFIAEPHPSWFGQTQIDDCEHSKDHNNFLLNHHRFFFFREYLSDFFNVPSRYVLWNSGSTQRGLLYANQLEVNMRTYCKHIAWIACSS